MDVTFNCEACGQQLVIDDAGAGMLIDCPHCKNLLLVPGQPKEFSNLAGHSSSSKSVPEEKKCPFCAEPINRRAIVCKHCGRDLVERRLTDAVTMRVQGGQEKQIESPVLRVIAEAAAALLFAGALVFVFWQRPTTQGSPSVAAPNSTTAIPKLPTPAQPELPTPALTPVPLRPPSTGPKPPRLYNVEFTLEAPFASAVKLAGEFNAWSATASPMRKRVDGEWSITLHLAPGRYQYKFVVDGKWIPDPMNPNQADDTYGGTNSVVAIGQ